MDKGTVRPWRGAERCPALMHSTLITVGQYVAEMVLAALSNGKSAQEEYRLPLPFLPNTNTSHLFLFYIIINYYLVDVIAMFLLQLLIYTVLEEVSHFVFAIETCVNSLYKTIENFLLYRTTLKITLVPVKLRGLNTVMQSSHVQQKA